MDFASYFLAVLLGSAPTVAVIGYLGKTLVDKLVAREAKREEAELKSRYDLINAVTASGLQRRNVEHQVQFTKLHERRVDVLANLYKHIAGALRAAEDFVKPGRGEYTPKNRTALAEEARKAVDALELYFDEHQIYLPPGVQEEARKLVKRLDGAVFEAGSFHDELGATIDSAEGEPGIDLTQWKEDKLKARVRAWREISVIGLTLRRSLESEFRKLLEPRADA